MSESATPFTTAGGERKCVILRHDIGCGPERALDIEKGKETIL